ncbi:prepilin-type N-terminal cleavage/methylation domain-containing protein [bacterium]|nr:prepilin-type N-terminal cleavage/methylation domain-containing protein [bacterium]
MFKKSAFTLIELLIVVAIIAILAAIAVPNFLEAQTRAKISRVHSDLRTIAGGAIMPYMVDHNKTPFLYDPSNYAANNAYMYNAYLFYHVRGDANHSLAGQYHTATLLTTPVAYLDTINYPDPFGAFGESHDSLDKAGYVCLSLQGALADGNFAQSWQAGGFAASYGWLSPRNFIVNGQSRSVSFLLVSPGPDKMWQAQATTIIGDNTGERAEMYVKGLVPAYDPTNGTASQGEIWRMD